MITFQVIMQHLLHYALYHLYRIEPGDLHDVTAAACVFVNTDLEV